MAPTSESTALEGDGQFYEYKAAGKLKDCKALITGGESVFSQIVLCFMSRLIANAALALAAR